MDHTPDRPAAPLPDPRQSYENTSTLRPDGRRPYTFDRVVRILFSVAAILAVMYLLDVLKGVLLPFLVACLLAYMLEPAVQWNMRWMHLRKRFIPVVMTLIETVVVITALCWVLIPYIAGECSDMASMIKHYATNNVHIPYLSDSVHRFLRENIDFNRLARYLTKEEWHEILKSGVQSSWNFLTSGVAFVVGVLSWFVVLLYLLFIMLDFERLMLSFRQLVPHTQRARVFRIMRDVKDAMNHYFRGQALIASLVGILFAAGFLIIGLPMGVVFGLLIGVMNMVPYLQLASRPIAAILCLVGSVAGVADGNFWLLFWETMGVYVVVQCIQDLFLTPKIMGKAMGLNPAIILLSLSIWGALLGFMGLIIALPLTTLLLSYYNQYVIDRN